MAARGVKVWHIANVLGLDHRTVQRVLKAEEGSEVCLGAKPEAKRKCTDD